MREPSTFEIALVWIRDLARPGVVFTLIALAGSGGAWAITQLVALGKLADRQDRTERRLDKLEDRFASFQKDLAERITSMDRQSTNTAVTVGSNTAALNAIHGMLQSMENHGREIDSRIIDYMNRLDERESRHNDQVMQMFKPVGAK